MSPTSASPGLPGSPTQHTTSSACFSTSSHQPRRRNVDIVARNRLRSISRLVVGRLVPVRHRLAGRLGCACVEVEAVVSRADAMLAQLHDAGIDPDDEVVEAAGIGRFAHVRDPAGTRLELWEPPRRPLIDASRRWIPSRALGPRYRCAAPRSSRDLLKILRRQVLWRRAAQWLRPAPPSTPAP